MRIKLLLYLRGYNYYKVYSNDETEVKRFIADKFDIYRYWIHICHKTANHMVVRFMNFTEKEKSK